MAYIAAVSGMDAEIYPISIAQIRSIFMAYVAAFRAADISRGNPASRHSSMVAAAGAGTARRGWSFRTFPGEATASALFTNAMAAPIVRARSGATGTASALKRAIFLSRSGGLCGAFRRPCRSTATFCIISFSGRGAVYVVYGLGERGRKRFATFAGFGLSLCYF